MGARLHVYMLPDCRHHKRLGGVQTEVQTGRRYHEFTESVVRGNGSQPTVHIVLTVCHKAECMVTARPRVYLKRRERWAIGLCRVFAVGHDLAATVEYQYTQVVQQVVQPVLHIGRNGAGVGTGTECTACIACTAACTDSTGHIGHQHSQADTRSDAFFHTCGIELIAHAPGQEQCTEKIQDYYLFHIDYCFRF